MGTADPLPGAGLLAAVAGPLFAGNLRQLGKREEANAAVSNNSLLERAIGRPWFRLLCRTTQYWLSDDSRVIHILAAEKCEQPLATALGVGQTKAREARLPPDPVFENVAAHPNGRC
jgi:hypothetical protein